MYPSTLHKIQPWDDGSIVNVPIMLHMLVITIILITIPYPPIKLLLLLETKKKELVFGKKLIPLTQLRIQMLYDLGFQFEPNKKESWYSRFQQLKSFYSTTKNSSRNTEMQRTHPRLY